MARTGHRVICWNERGEIVKPILEGEKHRVEVEKEHIDVIRKSDGKAVAVVYDGYAEVGEFRIIARGERRRILFCIERIGDSALLVGLAKHEEHEPITSRDITELALWLALLSSEAYSPGYSSWTWMVGHVPPKLSSAIRNATRAIKELKKMDQGDLVLGSEEKCEWFLEPITVLDRILGVSRDELDKYTKRLFEIMRKLEDGKELTREERKTLVNALWDIIWEKSLNR